MDHSILWAVIGLVLVIVELLTGTFYLLMLGLAAFGAAAAGSVSHSRQSIVAALVAAVGCYGVHSVSRKNKAQQMAPIDAGMPASFESWVDPKTRLARCATAARAGTRVEGFEGGIEPGRRSMCSPPTAIRFV